MVQGDPSTADMSAMARWHTPRSPIHSPAVRSGVGRTVVWCTVMALLAAACSGGDEVLIAAPTTTAATTTTTAPPSTTSTSTSTTTTTTTLPFTTTTTIYPGPWSPLNGLPAEEQVIDRRVIAVKIDNPPGRTSPDGAGVHRCGLRTDCRRWPHSIHCALPDREPRQDRTNPLWAPPPTRHW